jgi:ribose transport system substrate-binding protein
MENLIRFGPQASGHSDRRLVVNLVRKLTVMLVLTLLAGACAPTTAQPSPAPTSQATKAPAQVPTTAPTAAPAAQSTKKFVIGYANGWIGNTWRAQFLDDLEAKAKYYQDKGVLEKLIVVNSPADLNQQINQINGLIDQGVDALLIDPVSAPAVQPILPRAKSKGIFVMISNDPAPVDAINVVGDNYTWWKIQTEWLAKKLNGRGNIVMITGVPGNTADVLRVQAANDVLKNYPEIKVLTSAPGWWDEAKAQQAMATILASYPNIDALLIQDVMAEGVIRAFQAANRPLPKVMTGDYTAGFFRLWSQMPELESIGVPYAPAHAADSLGFAIRLLQGKKLKASALTANPLDPKLQNTVMIPPPLVVTRDGDKSQPWCTPLTQCISLQDALKLIEGKPDTYMLDRIMSEEEIDSFFEP